MNSPTLPQPNTLGNVWHLQEGEGCLYYLSDQWNGRVFGYEERGGVTLAQSGPTAVGILAFGGTHIAAERNLTEAYPHHIRDEHMDATQNAHMAAEASAACMLATFDARRHALPTTIALTQPQPSLYEAEALPGSPMRHRLAERLTAATRQLAAWGKHLYVDRVHLSLLEGAPDISVAAADMHYAAVARSLAIEICEITGQATPPHFLVVQSAGTSSDGPSLATLAEARLDINHPTLNFVCVSPSYWCQPQDGAASLARPADAMRLSELETHALDAIHRGGRWHCPVLAQAHQRRNKVFARFDAMTNIVLEDKARHGFRLDGVENGAELQNISTRRKEVVLEFDKRPEGNLFLSYGDDVNVGATLRDAWEAPSQTGAKLHRYAMIGHVPVLPHNPIVR